MTKRLRTETKRQIAQLENVKPATGPTREDAAIRAANARSLDSLQRTVERLNRMETQNAARRAAKSGLTAEEARRRIAPRILEIVARLEAIEIADGDNG